MPHDELPHSPTTAEVWADLDRREALARTNLEQEKQRAHLEGKEPFDLDEFDGLYTSPYAKTERTRDRAERVRSWETEYYMRSGDSVKTVAEFAARKRYNDENWL